MTYLESKEHIKAMIKRAKNPIIGVRLDALKVFMEHHEGLTATALEMDAAIHRLIKQLDQANNEGM